MKKYALETILAREKRRQYSFRLEAEEIHALQLLLNDLGGLKPQAAAVVNTINWETARQSKPLRKSAPAPAPVVSSAEDEIRVLINKLTDKTYLECLDKMVAVLEKADTLNSASLSETIFTIASQNRFYSKLYADLFSELITRFSFLKTSFDSYSKTAVAKFMVKADEFVEEETDYDLFCKMNENNDQRKSLAEFFVNLNINGIIKDDSIAYISSALLSQIMRLVKESDQKYSVDMMTELLAIFYSKERSNLMKGKTVELGEGEEAIDFNKCIKRFSKAKTADFKSLSKKTVFKFMDMIGV
jgi:hypothetical protein